MDNLEIFKLRNVYIFNISDYIWNIGSKIRNFTKNIERILSKILLRHEKDRFFKIN